MTQDQFESTFWGQHYDDRLNPFINAARGRDSNGINNDELVDAEFEVIETVIHEK